MRRTFTVKPSTSASGGTGYSDIRCTDEIDLSEFSEDAEKDNEDVEFILVLKYKDGLEEVVYDKKFDSEDMAELTALELLEDDPEVSEVEMLMNEFGGTYHNTTIHRPEDEIDDWDTFNGKRFMVDASKTNRYGELIERPTVITTNDPMVALEAWFKLAPTAPTETAIFVKTKADGVAVCRLATPETCTEFYNKYPKNPYKLDYLIEKAKQQVEAGCRGVHEGDLGDQVYPFCYG